MSGDVGRPMTQWPKERWAHPGWWALGMGGASLCFVLVGAWMNATTPGDFPNPLILIAFLLASLTGVPALFCLAIYLIGCIIFRSRRSAALDEP